MLHETLKSKQSKRGVHSLFTLLILSSVLAPLSALAANVTVLWDTVTKRVNGEAAIIGGYEVYYGTAAGNYSQVTNVGNVTRATVTGLVEGRTYYFSVKAFDISAPVLKSQFATEVQYVVPGGTTLPGTPPGFTPETPPGTPPSNPGSGNGGIGDNDPRKDLQGDFDGDGQSDMIFVKRAKGALKFRIILSGSSEAKTIDLSGPSIEEAVGAYDKSGNVNVGAVSVKGKSLLWQSVNLQTNVKTFEVFGSANEGFLSGCDFDGDGRTDKAVFSSKLVKFKRSIDGKIRQIRLPLRSAAGALSCGDVGGDGIDELFVKGSPLSVKGLSSKGSKLSRATGTEGLLVLNTAGRKIFARLVQKKSALFALSTGGDTNRAPTVLISGRKNYSAFWYPNGAEAPKTVSIPVLSSMTEIGFEQDAGKLEYGLLGIRKSDRHILRVSLGTGGIVDLGTPGAGEDLAAMINFVSPKARSAAARR